jgi:hypothetical protein
MRIEVDENGWDTEIKVVTANDAEELHLARDDRGHFRVYDENFDPASQSEVLDGIRGAASIAEDRHRWPENRYPDDGIDPANSPPRPRRKSSHSPSAVRLGGVSPAHKRWLLHQYCRYPSSGALVASIR